MNSPTGQVKRAQLIWNVWCGLRYSEPEQLWVSYCPMLDIRSQGRTDSEARAGLEDAVKLFLVTCHERGILPRVLSQLGLKVSGEPAGSDEEEDREYVAVQDFEKKFQLNVPFYLIAAEKARQGSDWRR